jgi:hypothetical protein
MMNAALHEKLGELSEQDGRRFKRENDFFPSFPSISQKEEGLLDAANKPCESVRLIAGAALHRSRYVGPAIRS